MGRVTKPTAAQPLWNQLVGQDLSAVVFVRDYLQLQFDGPTVNAYSKLITVSANGTTANFGEVAFANLVLNLIGRVVGEVSVLEHESFKILFVDGSRIEISIQPGNYCGPEAVSFHCLNGKLACF